MFRHLLGLLAGVAAAEGGPISGDASGSDCIGVHSTEATLSPGFATAAAGSSLNMPESWPAAQQVRKLVETGLALLLGRAAALSTDPKGGDPTYARKERHLAQLMESERLLRRNSSGLDVWNQTLHTAPSHKADAGREPKAVRIRPRCQRRPSQRRSNGLTIQNELPSLSDPAKQLQLGESAALLAIAKSKWYDKQWVGFATYDEQTKALWHEGVSLDWVKVEEAILASREEHEPRKALFWYGIFAGGYWRLDLHHAGMRRVLLQTRVI